MITSCSEKKVKKSSKISEDKVLELLFSKVGFPSNPMRISCVNVFNSFYRVNVWHSSNNAFLSNAGYISASYFFSINDEVVELK